MEAKISQKSIKVPIRFNCTCGNCQIIKNTEDEISDVFFALDVISYQNTLNLCSTAELDECMRILDRSTELN